MRLRKFLAISVFLISQSLGWAEDWGGVVVAYLPEYRWYVDVEAAVSCCITDLVLFSVSLKPNGAVDTHWIPEANFKRARLAADAVPGRAVNVLLCVGGAGRSAGFAAASKSKSKRKALVDSLASLVERHELDGVDFDWEAPRSAKEMADYALLLRAARRAFRPRGWLVTVALHPGQVLPGAGPSPASGRSAVSPYDFVDRVHLMAYDMRGSPGSTSGSDGTHASFSEATSAAMHQISAGLSASKLALGIPAYARHMQNPGAVQSYAEAMDSPSYGGSPQHRGTDVTADGFGLNGPETVRRKVEWARHQDLSGVMFWELGQDKLGHAESLLAAAAAAIGLHSAEVRADGTVVNPISS